MLLYHRIAKPPMDPWDLSVAPDIFDSHMALLASECHPLPLAELIQRALSNSLPERAVAVTFDDGYLDNLEAGLPVLERYGVPATIYVATGYVGAERAFWWDEVDQLLLGEGERPGHLEIELAGQTQRFATGTPAERRTALEGVLQHGVRRRATGQDIEQLLERLRSWAGLTVRPGPGGRPMKAQELASLASNPLIDLGAHSHTHPSLTSLDPRQQRSEVAASGAFMAELTGSRPGGFSYPFGDYERTTRRAVAAEGFEYAVTTDAWSPVTHVVSPTAVPRTAVPNEGAQRLRARLNRLLGAPPAGP